MFTRFTWISILFLCFLSFALAQQNEYVVKEFQKINEDYRSGNLSYEKALLEKFYYVFNRPKLNQKYR